MAKMTRAEAVELADELAGRDETSLGQDVVELLIALDVWTPTPEVEQVSINPVPDVTSPWEIVSEGMHRRGYTRLGGDGTIDHLKQVADAAGLQLVRPSDGDLVPLDVIAAEDAIRRHTWLGGHGCSHAVLSLNAAGIVLAKRAGA